MPKKGQETAKSWLIRMCSASSSPNMGKLCLLFNEEFDRMDSIYKANVGVHKTDKIGRNGKIKPAGTLKYHTRRSQWNLLAGCNDVAGNWHFYDDFVPVIAHGIPFLFPAAIEGAWRLGRELGHPAIQLNNSPHSHRGPQKHKWGNDLLITPPPNNFHMHGRIVTFPSPGQIFIRHLNIALILEPSRASYAQANIGGPEVALFLMRAVKKATCTNVSLDLRKPIIITPPNTLVSNK